MWIKADKAVEKTGQVTSQAQKKKHLSPSTRKRNAKCINQWKEKRNEAVGDSKTIIVVLCDFYVRLTLFGIADRFVFFLHAFRLLFSSRCCVGVDCLSPRSVSVV
jgi:hypothetical protein